jgi:hypothetical protein
MKTPGSRSGSKPAAAGRRASGSIVPIEWMINWRLPSGKTLAEFALQAGFLAPLMLSGPVPKRRARAGTSSEPKTAPGDNKPTAGEMGVGEMARQVVNHKAAGTR